MQPQSPFPTFDPRRARDDHVVVDAELARLPGPAAAFLRFCGVVGRPRARRAHVAWSGRYRTRVDAAFRRCTGRLELLRLDGARAAGARPRVGAAFPVVGNASYVREQGRLLAALLDLPAPEDVDAPASPGELAGWLNDAVVFAPSLLLSGGVAFAPAGPRAFDVVVDDAVGARVFLDERGAAIDFATRDRYGPAPRRGRAEWRTPLDDWAPHAGRMVPRRVRGLWRFPDAVFEVLELRVRPEDVRVDDPEADEPAADD